MFSTLLMDPPTFPSELIAIPCSFLNLLFVIDIKLLCSTSYLDTDECAESGGHECHVNADCKNTEGGYECQCRETYEGDGRDCEGIACIVRMLNWPILVPRIVAVSVNRRI